MIIKVLVAAAALAVLEQAQAMRLFPVHRTQLLLVLVESVTAPLVMGQILYLTL